MKKPSPKPRQFRSDVTTARGECLVDEVGSRIVDARIDHFDDATSSKELRRYAQWLLKAAKWVEGR